MIGNMIISGGPTGLSYNLLGNSSSPVQLERGWRVPTSQKSASLLARDPFIEVAESFPVQVVGTSEADVWQEYDAFVYFMQGINEARQKPDYDIYNFSIQATTGGTARQSMILGPVQNAPIVGPPTSPVDDANGFWRMRGVMVNFTRKGRFIDPASTVSSTTDTTQLADGTYEVTFAAEQPVDSPLKVTINTSPNNAKPDLAEGMLLVSNHDLVTAENSWRFAANTAVITGVGWTSFNDLARIPNTTGSNVSRWQATGNTAITSNDAVFSPTIRWRRVLVLAMIMNVTAGAGAIMRLNFKTLDLQDVRSETQPINGDGAAHVVNFGVVAVPTNGLDWFNVTLQNTTAALSDIRIERIICVNLDQPSVMIFRHGRISGSAVNFTLDPRYLTNLNPIFSGVGGVNAYIPSYIRGSQHVSHRLRGVRVLWLKPNGLDWDWKYNAGGRVTFSVQASVNPASLTPR